MLTYLGRQSNPPAGPPATPNPRSAPTSPPSHARACSSSPSMRASRRRPSPAAASRLAATPAPGPSATPRAARIHRTDHRALADHWGGGGSPALRSPKREDLAAAAASGELEAPTRHHAMSAGPSKGLQVCAYCTTSGVRQRRGRRAGRRESGPSTWPRATPSAPGR